MSNKSAEKYRKVKRIVNITKAIREIESRMKKGVWLWLLARVEFIGSGNRRIRSV